MKKIALLPISILTISLIVGCQKKEEPKTIYHTVCFNSNHGSFIKSVTVEENTKLSKPDNPTRTGYTFNMWSDKEDLSQEFNFDTPITSDITLYAKWDKNPIINTYTVSFNTMGGNFIPHQEVIENEKVTKPSNPIKEGYKFLYWYDKDSFVTTEQFDFNTPINRNITLCAKWEVSECVITFINHSEEETFGRVPPLAFINIGTRWGDIKNDHKTEYCHEGALFDKYSLVRFNEDTGKFTFNELYDDYIVNVDEFFVAFYRVHVEFENEVDNIGVLPFSNDDISLFRRTYNNDEQCLLWKDVKEEYEPINIEAGYAFTGFIIKGTREEIKDDTPVSYLINKTLVATYKKVSGEDFVNDDWDTFTFEMSKTKKEILDGPYGNIYNADTFTGPEPDSKAYPEELRNQVSKEKGTFVGLRRLIDIGHLGKYVVRVINEELVGEGSEDDKHFKLTFDFVLMIPVLKPLEYSYFSDFGITDYKSSTTRGYINDELYNELPEALRNSILDHETKTERISAIGEKFIDKSNDKLFLLSAKELGFKKIEVSGVEVEVPNEGIAYQFYKDIEQDNINYRKYTYDEHPSKNPSYWIRTMPCSSNQGFNYALSQKETFITLEKLETKLSRALVCPAFDYLANNK